MDDRPSEVKHAVCSSEKARRLLDYKTTTDLNESITNTVKYIRNRGTRSFAYDFPLEIINHKTPKTWKDKLI